MNHFTLAIPHPGASNSSHTDTTHPQTSSTSQPARFKRPRQITQFSYDDTHTYRPDASSLKYYYTPPLGASLSKGFPEKFIKHDDSKDDHLDGLLKAVIDLEREQERARSTSTSTSDDDKPQAKKLDIDLLTWRGMMTKILTAPYTQRDGFEMNATFFQGTIFIEENHAYKVNSRAKQASRKKQAGKGRPSDELMTYWGYKFEALAMLPRPWAECTRDFIESREDHVVSNAAQYCSVVETGAGGTSVLLGGEVDGVWDQLPIDPKDAVNWVELKTSAEIRDERGRERFENKLLKFWAQSFLLGVPRIVVGFRSDDVHGRLVKVQEFETTKIPKLVKESQGRPSWDSNVCIQFAADFLRWIKSHVTGDGVWRISRREGSYEIMLDKIEATGHGSILSAEFLEWRRSLGSGEHG